MSALDIQIGGEHYKNAKIQPVQYIEANALGFLEGCVVKRITRHDKPTGKGRQDIEKAIHELQLLLEFRYPEQPMDTGGLSTPEQRAAVYAALCSAQGAAQAGAVRRALDVCNQRTTPVSPAEDIYAEFAARINATERKFGKNPALGAGYGLVEDCPECGYPTDTAGTHYATCSQLTAPEEYKAKAQVAFDEAAEISEALARQVSAGTIVEPAAAMDDDSPRMQAIGQNGNDGEHYDDPFAGAPEWAKYKAQDEGGDWYWYEVPTRPGVSGWCENVGYDGRIQHAYAGEPDPNWRDTLITRA